jgi:DNA transformation protein
MPVDDKFFQYAMERLAHAGPVEARPMFGGLWVFLGGIAFGLIVADKIYFKVDNSNRPDYESAGMPQFVGHRGRSMGFWQVPQAVLDNPDTLSAWVAKAIAVARAKKEKIV